MIHENLYTLLGKIMACFIMTGEIIYVERYGGFSSKPPIFPGHNFTFDFCFGFYNGGEIIDREKYGDLGQNRHFPPPL